MIMIAGGETEWDWRPQREDRRGMEGFSAQVSFYQNPKILLVDLDDGTRMHSITYLKKNNDIFTIPELTSIAMIGTNTDV